MKKMLFVMNNLSSGGAEKSLSSLLRNIDFSKYEVDLLLFKSGGIFFQDLPNKINILNEPEEYKFFDMSIKKAIKDSIKMGRADIAFLRAKASYIFRMEQNKARCEQRAWKYVGATLKRMDKRYDVAIGYLEKSSIYYVIEKVNAKKKIGWIHTHYTNSGMDRKIDVPYFQQLDHIVTVSEECANSLYENFEYLKPRIKVIKNIVSPTTIKALSKIEKNLLNFDPRYINIVTVARLSFEKGIDMAVESCKILVNKGLKIKWYVIGFGNNTELDEINKLIAQKDLKESFLLLGVHGNPYPYIKNADIYVQPSRYEGKSIAIDEAKILEKPIIVTNYSSAKDQIENNVNGMIVEMSAKCISEGINTLLKNKNKMDFFSKSLSKENLGTESEIKKLYEIS